VLAVSKLGYKQDVSGIREKHIKALSIVKVRSTGLRVGVNSRGRSRH
jgi:hypothetical protein